MVVHEPPLRSFIQEGQLVQEVVEYAITEHRESCPWRAILEASPALACMVACCRPSPRPEGELLRQPQLLVVADLAAVHELAARALRQGGAAKPPVATNLVALLDPERLVYIRDATMEARAEHLLAGDSWVIRVNRVLGRNARRFAIMSQGFHLMRAARGLELQSHGTAALNWLADRFAAYVLMPEEWVRELHAKTENLASLAGIFQVSQTAMRIRLRELGLADFPAER
ncbi:MAG: ImmA/IrrE family metallo-endopeptidase [Sphingomonadaceae bacterium]